MIIDDGGGGNYASELSFGRRDVEPDPDELGEMF